MRTQTNKKFPTDAQLLIFLDAAREGRTLEESKSLAGFILPLETEEEIEMKGYYELERKIAVATDGISVPESLASRILLAIPEAVGASVSENENPFAAKSRFAGMKLNTPSPWKFGAPVAILAFLLIIVVNVGQNEEMTSMPAADTNQVGFAPEGATMSLKMDALPEARMMMSVPSTPMPENADEIIAMMTEEANGEEEAVSDTELLQEELSLDIEALKSLEKTYDETNF